MLGNLLTLLPSPWRTNLATINVLPWTGYIHAWGCQSSLCQGLCIQGDVKYNYYNPGFLTRSQALKLSPLQVIRAPEPRERQPWPTGSFPHTPRASTCRSGEVKCCESPFSQGDCGQDRRFMVAIWGPCCVVCHENAVLGFQRQAFSLSYSGE